MFFDDLLFFPEDFFKVLCFDGGCIGGEMIGDEITPFVMCNVSGRLETSEEEGGRVGGPLFSTIGVLDKASSAGEEREETILDLCWRTNSASATLVFHDSSKRFAICRKTKGRYSSIFPETASVYRRNCS